MKLTNGEIYEAKEPLQRLIGEKLPVLVSYRLSKLVLAINPQLQIIESVRSGLIRKYGTLSNDGREASVKPGDEKFNEFAGEYAELLAQEVDLDIQPVTLTGVAFDIEPSVFMALEKFIEVAG